MKVIISRQNRKPTRPQELTVVSICITYLADRYQIADKVVYQFLVKSNLLYDEIVPNWSIYQSMNPDEIVDSLSWQLRERGVKLNEHSVSWF